MKTFIITNDRYSNQPCEVTLEQLVKDFEGKFQAAGTTDSTGGYVACIRDERNEVVAVEKAAYETNDFVA